MPKFDAGYVPRSAMAIYAHPDDIEFTVAGTVAKWARAGCEVTFVLLTSGNAGTHDRKFTRKSLGRVRERRSGNPPGSSAPPASSSCVTTTANSSPPLGCGRSWSGGSAGTARGHAVQRPPGPLLRRPVHQPPGPLAAGKTALEAVFPCAEMELLWPGAGPVHKVHAVYVSSTTAPDTWIDVTETIDLKIAALSAHRSQLGDRDIAPLILGWAKDAARRSPARKADGKGRPRRPKYAEAFRVMRLLREEK